MTVSPSRAGRQQRIIELVGERLIRAGKDRFWKDGFDIYFDGELLSRCEKDEATCEVTVGAPP